MSDKIYEDRTTEEIKAINDIDINTNNKKGLDALDID